MVVVHQRLTIFPNKNGFQNKLNKFSGAIKIVHTMNAAICMVIEQISGFAMTKIKTNQSSGQAKNIDFESMSPKIQQIIVAFLSDVKSKNMKKGFLEYIFHSASLPFVT